LIIYSGARYWGGIENYLLYLFKFYERGREELVLVLSGRNGHCLKGLNQKDIESFFFPGQESG
jgi:hypothetical protein